MIRSFWIAVFVAVLANISLGQPPPTTTSGGGSLRLGTEIGNGRDEFTVVYRGESGGLPFEVRSYTNTGEFVVAIKGKSDTVIPRGGNVAMPGGDKLTVGVIGRTTRAVPDYTDDGWREAKEGVSQFPAYTRPVGRSGQSLQILVVPSDEQVIAIAQWTGEEPPAEFQMLYESARGISF